MEANRKEIEVIEKQTLIGGRYIVVKTLGVGRTGIVYEVADQQLDGERIALKLLYPHLLQDPTMKQRFSEEVFLVRQLNHPNIVRLYEIELGTMGQQFITMELVSEFSLRHIIDHLARDFSEDEVRSVVSQLLLALRVGHQKGIIHRDIKPENILVEHTGILKLGDFGCFQSSETDRLTQTGQLIGTPAYMAPEQFLATEVSSATDMYAIGVLAYELMSGSVPFKDSTLYELALSHTKIAPQTEELPKRFSATLRSFVEQCLRKEQEFRVQNADEALQLLPVSSAKSETSILARLINDYFTDSRTSKSSIKRSIITHSLLFVLILIPTLLFLLNHEITNPIYSDLIRIEHYFKLDVPRLRSFLAVPDISLREKKSIYKAVDDEDMRRIKIWCIAGVLPIEKNSTGETLIHKFLRNPKMLVAAQDFESECLPAEVYDRPNKKGDFPITYAIRFGHVGAVRALVKADYNPNVYDRAGLSALSLAVKSRNPLLVQALQEKDTRFLKLDKDPKQIPLFEAVAVGDVAIVETLLDMGSNIKLRDESGLSALMFSAKAPEEVQVELVELLVKRGADCAALDNSGRSVLDHFSGNARSGGVELLEKCLKPQAIVNENRS